MLNTKKVPGLLGFYQNGNYYVRIYSDGTKIRENNADNLTPSFPESIDLTITRKCDGKCLFCYEDCTPDGKHGDILNAKFIDTLRPYTEVAINGNDLTHPDLIAFLTKLKDKKIIANMSVNQNHFMKNIDYIRSICDSKLVYGLGISLVSPTDEFIESVKEFPNAIVHVISGIFCESDFNRLRDNNLKLLILGYKRKGRGDEFFNINQKSIIYRRNWIRRHFKEIINVFKSVSFDNLALDQVLVKKRVTDEQWKEIYMGDDGEYTMYVDLVNNRFARNSTTSLTYPLKDNIDDMFKVVKEERGI